MTQETWRFWPRNRQRNRLSTVDKQKLHRFGWYPFSPELAQKIPETQKIVVSSRNQSYAIIIEKGNRLVAYRNNTIRLQMQKGSFGHKETVYVLGVENKLVLNISRPYAWVWNWTWVVAEKNRTWWTRLSSLYSRGAICGGQCWRRRFWLRAILWLREQDSTTDCGTY